MPHRPRISDAGYVHHVISRGNNGQDIFLWPEDFHAFIDMMSLARSEHPVFLYNYVLMNNHLHFLVEPRQDGSLIKFMEASLKNYARYFNKKYDHKGHVFQGRYKDFIVQAELYFFRCSNYIDLNPVKAGLVKKPEEYLFSGYANLALEKRGFVELNGHSLYLGLGENKKERASRYRIICSGFRTEEIDLFRRRSFVLGDKDFQAKVLSR